MRTDHSWRSLFATLCGMAAAVVLSIAVLSVTAFVREEGQTAAQGGSVGWIVSEYGGKLAVFAEGQELPDRVYDIYVRHLPQLDQELLAQGIPAKTPEELRRILEDYTG
ncbi:MAG: hypothetical protein IJY82_00010 [Oscillospiraceae bacterium]|nr:hypothetical protein [Oscillospiraceae bacterium]MBQ8731196.1 hypothetical protein [Oscillospiraceae bacterium]